MNESGNVSIECSASGNPIPTITLTGPSNVTVQHNMGNATLVNLNRNQAGLYICRANNGVHSPVSAAIELVVNCTYLIYCYIFSTILFEAFIF